MAQVKGKGTSAERALEAILVARGVSFDSHVSDLPGKPDIVFRDLEVAVFVDGCFWHGCPDHCRIPQTNREYWQNKITRNMERSVQQTIDLQGSGWAVLRIWEHELKRPLIETTTKRIIAALCVNRAGD
jgi:DNA mismatch endonuclease (patch repair protein)